MKNVNPFSNSDTNKRYHTYDYHMRQMFGGKVMKIPLDGGFTCPNIDGTRGRGGCTYCTKQTLPYRGMPLDVQFEQGKAPLVKKWRRDGRREMFIPYFQVFTNTYASVERLRELYYGALALPDTVGLSIATRADCINSENTALLREISEKTYLTVELGLQTVHESTAVHINRGHTYAEFLAGCEMLSGMNVCVHLINGLPGENAEMMLESARQVAALRPHSVKIHMLYLERGCRMTDEYLESPFHVLTEEEYVSITVSQLEMFHPDTVIGRLTGDGVADNVVAPLWSKKKFCVLNDIDKEFVKRGSFQGKYFSER